jgi:hypothetical protein
MNANGANGSNEKIKYLWVMMLPLSETKAQEVIIFWDAAFFRAWYSRCFLLISFFC